MWRTKNIFKLILFLCAQVDNTGKEPAVRQATSGGMCAIRGQGGGNQKSAPPSPKSFIYYFSPPGRKFWKIEKNW